MKKQRILIPLDGSDFSQKIVPYIRQFFMPEQTELVLFHLTPQPEGIHVHRDHVHLDIYVDQVEASKQNELENAFHDDIEKLQEAGYTARIGIGFGDDPAQAILSVVEEEEIDLVAMTTHGYTGLRRALAGSVAESVLRNVNVPVLLLRPFTAPPAVFPQTETRTVPDFKVRY